MKIIAVNEGHSASCIYFEDGSVKFALQEERLSRKKNQHGFPHAALNYLKVVEGVDFGSVDSFILTSGYLPYGTDNREERIKGYARRSLLAPVKRLLK